MFSILQSYVAIPIAVLIVFFLLVAIARPDRDDTGDGLYPVYLSVVGITALYLVLVFGVTCLDAIAERVIVDQSPGSEQGVGSFESDGVATPLLGGSSDDPDHATQTAVWSALLTLGAAVVFAFHHTRRRELTTAEGFSDSTAARVDRAYCGAVSFIAVSVGVIALSVAGYGAFRIIAPDITGSRQTFEEQQGLAQLIAFGALLAGTIALFRTHFWAVRDPSSVIDD